MWYKVRAIVTVAVVLLVTAVTQEVTATGNGQQIRGAVFVMTNSIDPIRGNEVVMYNRRANGTLLLHGYFPTGGLGSGPAPTSMILGPPLPVAIDGLGSQNSLALSSNNRFVFAVNAGSNTISSFRVFVGEGIRLVSTVPSGGVFPVSLTVDHNLLYVLNAGGQGSIQGFTVDGDGELTPLAGSHRNLGAVETIPPPTEVLTSPAQVGFTPDGNKLVVTVKGVPPSAGSIIVFSIDNAGLPFHKVVTNLGPGNGIGPFGFVFDKRDHLIVTNGVSNDLTSYAIRANNQLIQLSGPAPTGAFAPCWIAQSGPFSYVGNIGGNDPPAFPFPGGTGIISRATIDKHGNLTDTTVVAVELPTTTSDNHAIDLTVVDDKGSGPFLYFLQSRAGRVGMQKIAADGSLIDLGSVGGLNPSPDPTTPSILLFLTRCFLQTPPLSPECAEGSVQGIVGF